MIVLGLAGCGSNEPQDAITPFVQPYPSAQTAGDLTDRAAGPIAGLYTGPPVQLSECRLGGTSIIDSDNAEPKQPLSVEAVILRYAAQNDAPTSGWLVSGNGTRVTAFLPSQDRHRAVAILVMERRTSADGSIVRHELVRTEYRATGEACRE